MKQVLITAAPGLVMLAGLVGFSVLPQSAGEPPDVAERAETLPPVEEAACRQFDLGLAATDLDEAMENLVVAVSFEREGGDGGLGFSDWVDTELVSRALTEVGDVATALGLAPGLPEEIYDSAREVVRAASSLEVAAISGSIFSAEAVDDERLALLEAIGAVEQTCA